MQQIVDPFMPVTMQLKRPVVRPVHRIVPRQRPVVLPRRTVDGMVSRPVQRTFTPKSELRQPANSLEKPQVNQNLSEVKTPARIGQQTVFENQFAPTAPAHKTASAPAHAAKKGKAKAIFSALQVPAIILVSVVIGYFMQSLELGEIAIGIYAVAALIFKVSSRTTFTLALLALFVIIALVITKPDSSLAANFAVYTFLLMVVGTISLGREVRTETA